MSFENARRGVHVSVGDGIVAHLPSLTAFAKGETGRLNELLVRLSALADAGWQDTVRTITAGISEAGFDDHPSIACVSVEKNKLAAFVYGAVELTAIIDGESTVLDGRDSSTWIDVVLRGEVEQVHAGSKVEASLIGILRDGVVPAGGFLLETSGPLPATGQWDSAINAIESNPTSSETDNTDETDAAAIDESPVVESEDSDQAGVTGMFARIEQLSRDEDSAPIDDLANTAETEIEPGPDDSATADSIPEMPNATEASDSTLPHPPEPATSGDETAGDAEATAARTGTATMWKDRPELRGVRCTAGHFTAPEPTCRTCDIPIDSTMNSATGTRPVLGHVIFDDGAVLQIDRPAVIGADVPQGYSIDDEPTTIVRLDDGHGGVSDLQLEIRASGWNVEIVDMHSENGTYTMLQGERQTRTRLRSGQAVTLLDGMTVETGTRTFTFGRGPHAPA